MSLALAGASFPPLAEPQFCDRFSDADSPTAFRGVAHGRSLAKRVLTFLFYK